MGGEQVVGARVQAHAVANGSAMNNEEIHQATRDSIRAIMMIRAYRMRGHLHADLDPLELEGKREAHNELHPSSYGFIEADYHRPIFLDYVLGLEFATIPEMLEILKRTLLLDHGCRVYAYFQSGRKIMGSTAY